MQSIVVTVIAILIFNIVGEIVGINEVPIYNFIKGLMVAHLNYMAL